MPPKMHRVSRVALAAGLALLTAIAVSSMVVGNDDDSDGAVSDDGPDDGPAVGPLDRISQPTPLADCPGLPGTEDNFAVEPSLAVNPTDPDNLIAAWQQDRSFASRGNVAAYSTNGGESWKVAVVPGANTCSEGQLGVADAWLTFDAAGTAYLASLPGRAADGRIVSGVIVNTSADGGRTWSEPSPVTGFTAFDDKPAITAHPSRSGVVYAVWDRSQFEVGAESERECEGESDCTTTIYFARSEDSAASWSEPEAVAVPDGDVRQTDARIVVLPDGSLRIFYEQKPKEIVRDASGQDLQLMMVGSDDGGHRWSEPREVLTLHHYIPFTPSGGMFFALYEEAVTVDEDGNIYVVSTQNDSADTSAQSRVELRISQDAGASWGRPEAIAEPEGFATLPTVAAADEGVAVTWYDFASDTPEEAGVTLSYRAATRPIDSERWSQRDIVGFDAERCGLFSREGLPGAKLPWIGEYFGLVPLDNGRFATALVACAPAADLGLEDILFTTFR